MSEPDIAQVFLTFKFRLLPTRAQHGALTRILEDQRQLYNAALQERIGCYEKTGKSLSYMSQCKSLAVWRGLEDVGVPSNLQRWTIRRLDFAYSGFFRRIKRGEKAGFPRFKGRGRWRSFGFNETDGIRLIGNRLRFKGLPGGLRVHFHRDIPAGSEIKSYTFTKDHKGWSVGIVLSPPLKAAVRGDRATGIDLGLKSFAALSDGSEIPAPKIAKKVEKELRRRQRALSRCKRGSKRRAKVRGQVTRHHAKVSNTRRTFLHQASAKIVRDHDIIAIEALNVRGLAGGMLSKPVHDAGWGMFIAMLRYKAAKADTRLIEVDPRNTTQACSGCGQIVPKGLNVRIHSCDCGTVLDRDHNAALNILAKAVVGLGLANVGHQVVRPAGNITLKDSK